MRSAKDALDREVTGIGIVPVLAAAQSPTLLQLFKRVTIAIYPFAHVGHNDVAAKLCPIDRETDGMFRRVITNSEPTKAVDRRLEFNEIIEKSEELFGYRFIDRYPFAIAECDGLVVCWRNRCTCFHVELAPRRSVPLRVAVHMLGWLTAIQ